MRERIFSSAIVVVVGLAATLFGGPVFALFMVILSVAGYREFVALTPLAIDRDLFARTIVGIIVFSMMAAAGLAGTNATVLFVAVASAISAPLIALLAKPPFSGALNSWALSSAGLLYIGLPVYAAVALRTMSGADSPAWLTALADTLSLGWYSAPVGLAWALTAIVATWIGDSMAFLVGRSLGNTRLAPSVSPGKTVEGSVAGLIGSALVGGAAFSQFSLGPWWAGVGVGCIIGVAGQLGDLCESFLKRQAGVKDSGNLLPGHGGVLDRVDALLFAFPVSLVLAATFEKLDML